MLAQTWHGRAEAAAVSADASVRGHLERGLAYWRSGDLVQARNEFETVLVLDSLPPDLNQQLALYVRLAEARLAGEALIVSGYVAAGGGRYREGDTVAGAGEADDGFAGVRLAGRLNYVQTDAFSIKASVDYWFRGYDDSKRRRDSDLFWDLGFARVAGNANLSAGVRGWAQYVGEGSIRNDHGVYAEAQWQGGADSQFGIGVELRRRSYPEGRYRELTRNIAEANLSWTQALLAGKASLGVIGRVGREFALADKPDGNSNLFMIESELNVALTGTLGFNLVGIWQNNRFTAERIIGREADNGPGPGGRNDNLFEFGGGLAWNFAPGWELNPGFLHLRDVSSRKDANYRATEVYLLLRRDF